MKSQLRSRRPPKRSAGIKQRVPVKRRNPKRRKSEFARCYHSKARVEWVKSRPCVGCGISGFSENAHIENGGMGRKADFDKVVPLCGPHGYNPGCHRILHGTPRHLFEKWRRINLNRCAEATQSAWRASQGETE